MVGVKNSIQVNEKNTMGTTQSDEDNIELKQHLHRFENERQCKICPEQPTEIVFLYHVGIFVAAPVAQQLCRNGRCLEKITHVI